MEQQHRPGHNSATASAKVEWKKELNKIAMECYFQSEPKKRWFRKRMLKIWNEIGMFSITEQQHASQVLFLRNGKNLMKLEVEEIRRKINEPTEIEAEEEQLDEHVEPIHDSNTMKKIDDQEDRYVNLKRDLNTENLSDE